MTTLCRAHKAIVKDFYPGVLADGTVRWQAAGRTPGSAPAVLLQKLEALLKLAQEEASGYDYQRVEDAVVDAMQLPINPQRLKRDA